MKDPLDTWATWREIHAQPAIWRDWAGAGAIAAARDWVRDQTVDEVWFCGAGSSAYIGEIVTAGLEGKGRFRAVATTDLVSRPRAHLSGRTPLVVSFGRSGDSAESIGTLDVLDNLAPDAPRLNITCNPAGALATRPSPGPQHVIRLPEACHDAGFAMTSSFTTMLLTALAVFEPEGGEQRFAPLADSLAELLPRYRALAGAVPGRAVFLGTGPLAFAAREAALKVMELAAGEVPALWDSPLGFRHGPKSFVTDDTAICLFLSDEQPARAYEDDLAEELRAQFPATRLIRIGPGGAPAFDAPFGPAWSAPLAIAFAQVAGVVWSAALGKDVDDPFRGKGTLSRVVAGVRMHGVA